MSSKTSFVLGIIITIAVMSTIGFFVTASMLFKQGGVAGTGITSGAGAENSGNNAVQPPKPAADGGSSNIQIASVTDKDHIRGDKNAPVSIVEFSDLECPFCKRFHTTMKQAVDEYNGKVNWVYRHFPLDSLHSKARKEAEATECAAELGGNDAFWKYIDRLFEITPSNNGLDLNELPQIAEYAGLNKNKFKECLDSGKYAQKIANELSQAQLAGGRGTPYSVIIAGDKKVPISGALPIEDVRSAIDSLLN